MNDLISVIVPAYNSERYITDCLASIQKQTYPYFEVIVVDDGSEDRTLKICSQIAKDDQRIIVHHQSKQGVSEARNHGIDLSKGSYLVFLDSDDMLHPFFLEKMLDRIKQTNADAAGCRFIKISSDKMKKEAEILFQKPVLAQWISIPEDHILEWFHENENIDTYMICCKMIKRDVIGNLRFEKGIKLGEDTLFLYHLVLKGIHLEILPEPMYLYRMHMQSTIHNWDNVKEKNPYAVYMKIRDEEYKSGRLEYAEQWEASYLMLLIKKYNLAKKYGEKEVCKKLRREALCAMKYKHFTNSRIMFFLTFYCPPLFEFCSYIINSIREKKEKNE